MTSDLINDKRYIIGEEENQDIEPNFEMNDQDAFLPDINLDAVMYFLFHDFCFCTYQLQQDSFTLEELRSGAAVDDSFMRKASIASSRIHTPLGYSEDPEVERYQSTPMGGDNTPLFGTSPLPHRRASSIRSIPESPSYVEPQYFDAPSTIMPEYVPTELVTSINENSVKMLKHVRSKLQDNISIQFSDVTKNMNRSQCAKSFFELLVLSSTGYLDCLQTSPYGEITIRAGDLIL